MSTRTTRSSAAKASSSAIKLEDDSSELSDVPSSNGVHLQDDESESPETHIAAASRGLRKLRSELARTRKRNAEMEVELARLRDAEAESFQPKRGKKAGPSNSVLLAEVRKLKVEVERLEKRRRIDKKTISKFEKREAKKEAAELQDEVEDTLDDSAYHMRKLLRRFADLMAVNGLLKDDEAEECPICQENMELNKCSSFPCEHMLCNDCVPLLYQKAAADERVPCPTCRKPWLIGDAEDVDYTPRSQWDALTDIAREWAAVDRRHEMETSEEEAEETFIDDPKPEDGSSSDAESANQGALPDTAAEAQQEHATGSVLPAEGADAERSDGGERGRRSKEPEAEAGPSTPPQQNAPLPYAQTPAAEKRQRMEVLAAERERKRHRR